jgi:hypothetical protein
MSNQENLHPGADELLQFADGDLADAAMKGVRDHVAECGGCRATLNGLERGVTDYNEVWMPWKAAADEPPKPWFDIRRQMQQLDRLPVRVPAHRVRFRPQWVAAAAAIVLSVVALFWMSERPANAAQLLADAARREAAAGRARSPIRIATRSHNMVRPALWQAPQQRPPAAGFADSLRARFEEANYSWNDPLSAQSFAAWRAGLPDAQDDVVQHRPGDGTGSYEIITRTGTGTLAEASLRLRAPDLHAIEGRLRFRDEEVVDISEDPDASPDLTTSSAIPAAPGASGPPDAAPVEEAVTAGDELRVRVALRRIDADLGEPIKVERDDSANAVVVTALGLTPERRRVLADALGGLSRVELRFREPQPVREAARRLSDSRSETPPDRTFDTEFVNSTLEASQSALLRAHAIRELAEHYPPEVEARLPTTDRESLDWLLANHYAGLENASMRVLEQARRITTQSVPAGDVPSQRWQDHARSLVTAAQVVDQLLTGLLAAGGTAGRPLDDLERALGRLESETAAAAPAFRGRR